MSQVTIDSNKQGPKINMTKQYQEQDAQVTVTY